MDEYRPTRVILFFSVLSLLMYAAAFVVPGPSLTDDSKPVPFWGTMVFYFGLAFCWALWKVYAWWANVVFWIALFCRADSGRIWALGAGLLALSYWVYDADNEMIGLPYFLWMGSMFVYALACHLMVEAETARFGESEIK